jgi:hypothetical protein
MDVFFPVFRAQPQVIVQTTADIVAVHEITADTHIEQAFFEGMGQGGFSAAGKAGEPDQGASVAVETVAVGSLGVRG